MFFLVVKGLKKFIIVISHLLYIFEHIRDGDLKWKFGWSTSRPISAHGRGARVLGQRNWQQSIIITLWVEDGVTLTQLLLKYNPGPIHPNYLHQDLAREQAERGGVTT